MEHVHVRVGRDCAGELCVVRQLQQFEDEDTASNLSDLLSAYQAAMDAEKEALDAEDTDEEALAALREASESARTALLDALKEAGIEQADYTAVEDMLDRPESDREELQTPPEKPEGDLAPEKPEGDEAPEKPEDDGNAPTDNGGIFNRARTAIQNMASNIGNWFSGLLK